MPYLPPRVECPYIGAPPRVQWRVAQAGRIGSGQIGRPGRKMLDRRDGNAHAVAPSHQHTVLGPAQIRNTHGKPYPDRQESHGKGEGCNVCEHAMAKIVRFFPVALIARQIVRRAMLLNRVAQVPALTRRSQGSRPELKHAVLPIRRDRRRNNGPLGFHWCQLRDILNLFSTLATRLPENVGMAGTLSLHSLVEPAVVDSKPTIFRGADDVRVAVSKSDVGIIV